MLKRSINRIFGTLGYKVRRKSQKQQLSDTFKVQKLLIGKRDKPIIIFDVGAADGSTTIKYRQYFRRSIIYSFEPIEESFIKLSKTCSAMPNVHLYNIALGKSRGTTKFVINEAADTSSLLKPHPEGIKIWQHQGLREKQIDHVKIERLDSFIKTHSIDKIDILKMDVQGTEHNIMKGAENAIQNNKIEIIYCEILIAQTYYNQESFSNIIDMYYSYGYRLFNFYNLNLSAIGELRQLDAIFIKSKLS